MIRFYEPILLGLLVAWAISWWRFRGVQQRALDWIREQVSERFRSALTAYDAGSLARHLALLFAMGALLAVSAAGPALPGASEEGSLTGRVLLLIDASASMKAGDVDPSTVGEGRPAERLEAARKTALDLVAGLDGFRLAVATFSGVATLQVPMTDDRQLAEAALATFEDHTFYQNTGSSFREALDLALHFVDERYRDLQVVLISDGEQQGPDEAADYGGPLGALARQRVPVHAVAVGSHAGEARLIYDFRDVVAGKEPDERAVLSRHTTRRVDRHLQAIADATGGSFIAIEGGVAGEAVGPLPVAVRLAERIRSRPPELRPVEREGGLRDLSRWPLALFLLLFVADSLDLWRRRRPTATGFDLSRLGSPPAGGGRRGPGAVAGSLVVLVLLGSCGGGESPILRAHRENEDGIAFDRLAQREVARRRYERSISYEFRPQVPTYNLARSLTESGVYAQAHTTYQRALELDPELDEAYFNDGVTLYLWGEKERDPRGCQLERTLDLWQNAAKRLDTVIERTDAGDELGRAARENRAFVERRIREVEALIASPPPECSAASEAATGGGETEEGGSAGGGEEESEGGGGGAAEGEEEEETEGGGGAGGEGEEEEREPREDGPTRDDPQEDGPQEDAPQGEEGDPREGEGGPGDGEGEGETESGGGSGSAGSAGGPSGLGEADLEEIRAALERIDQQREEEGKFFRRTLPEQFPSEVWLNPDKIIWW